jgi:hypothetical protein
MHHQRNREAAGEWKHADAKGALNIFAASLARTGCVSLLQIGTGGVFLCRHFPKRRHTLRPMLFAVLF